MNTSELLKQLRERTQAGMKDCHDALRESSNDLEKAVDLLKTKGKNIASGRSNRVAAEGVVVADHIYGTKSVGMIEVNCQTDFVARSSEFKTFAQQAFNLLKDAADQNVFLDVNSQEAANLRNDIVNKTKENCVIRRWWIEEVVNDTCKTFFYIHNGSKLGVILSLQASSVFAANSEEFNNLGNDLAMQVAAMAPLAVSSDRLPTDVVTRQKDIFETQLRELNKPAAAQAKIMEGKFQKFYSEVCLLDQESAIVPKTSVKTLIQNVATKLDSDIKVINFIRCTVGEGLEQVQSSLADEVAKLM